MRTNANSPFASLRAGIYLSRTHGRIQPRTVWNIRESALSSPLRALTSNSSFSLLARTRPPYIPSLHSFSLRISERSRRPCTLPQLSATVISFGYFCPRIALPLYIAAALPCCTFLLIMQPYASCSSSSPEERVAREILKRVRII